MKMIAAVSALNALAHENRLAIFRMLVEAGPEGLTVGHIGKKLSIPGATLSFHLSQLKQADLVEVRRDGRQLIHTANFTCMNALVGYLTENCCGGLMSCAPVCKPANAKAVREVRKKAG
jgi:ArsR family transcriptional regulator